jgi:hypothetical protein
VFSLVGINLSLIGRTDNPLQRSQGIGHSR